MDSKFHVDFNDPNPHLEPVTASAIPITDKNADLYDDPGEASLTSIRDHDSPDSSTITASSSTRRPQIPPVSPHDQPTPPATQTTTREAPPARAELEVSTVARHLWTFLLTTILTTFLSSHVYILHTASVYGLVRIYAFTFVVMLYFLASMILGMGILVPPVMLVHWVWETLNESNSQGGNQAVAEVERADIA